MKWADSDTWNPRKIRFFDFFAAVIFVCGCYRIGEIVGFFLEKMI